MLFSKSFIVIDDVNQNSVEPQVKDILFNGSHYKLMTLSNFQEMQKIQSLPSNLVIDNYNQLIDNYNQIIQTIAPVLCDETLNRSTSEFF